CRRPRAGGHPHDARPSAAILEELLDRVGERRGLPQAAEVLLELVETVDRESLIDRPLESAADECRDGSRHTLDRVVVTALLCELYAGRGAVGHSSASVNLPA